MPRPPHALPELAPPGAGGLIRLPGSGDVPFTPRVRALVDTPALQRLRHVSQLGVASRVYPGATHTRFEHTLGVYGNAVRCLRSLATVEAFAGRATAHDAEMFLAAALLHDVGHWPFCHPMEDLKLPDVPDHEHRAAARFAPGTPAGDVLERDWGVEPAEVADFLTGDGATDSPARGLLRGLLDGPIDVDKMDYLERDSLHAGVPYGRNFDKDRLIASLTVHPRFAEGNRLDGTGGLALTTKGRTAAELLVFARYVMFAEVYWHHTVRAATAMLLRAVYDRRAGFIRPDLFETTDPQFEERLLHACAGTSAARLAEGLFRPAAGRGIYKRLAEFGPHEGADLFRRLSGRPYAELAAVSEALAILLQGTADTPRDLEPTDLLLDAPPAHREVQFRVDVIGADGTARPLSEVSPVTRTLAAEQFDDHVKRVRLFGHPRLREALRPLDWPALLHAAADAAL